MAALDLFGVPPCPGDPELYTLVTLPSGRRIWRRKRGTVKPVQPNASFKGNISRMGVASPTSSMLLGKLSEFLVPLLTGDLPNQVTRILMKALKERNRMDFLGFMDLEMQPKHHMNKLLFSYKVTKEGNSVTIKVPISKDMVKRHNKIVTHFYFEIIMIAGDLSKRESLRIDSTESALYSFSDRNRKDCTLEITIPPKKPWMVMLKVSCMEGNEMAAHGRNYGMKVVAVG